MTVFPLPERLDGWNAPTAILPVASAPFELSEDDKVFLGCGKAAALFTLFFSILITLLIVDPGFPSAAYLTSLSGVISLGGMFGKLRLCSPADVTLAGWLAYGAAIVSVLLTAVTGYFHYLSALG